MSVIVLKGITAERVNSVTVERATAGSDPELLDSFRVHWRNPNDDESLAIAKAYADLHLSGAAMAQPDEAADVDALFDNLKACKLAINDKIRAFCLRFEGSDYDAEPVGDVLDEMLKHTVYTRGLFASLYELTSGEAQRKNSRKPDTSGKPKSSRKKTPTKARKKAAKAS